MHLPFELAVESPPPTPRPYSIAVLGPRCHRTSFCFGDHFPVPMRPAPSNARAKRCTCTAGLHCGPMFISIPLSSLCFRELLWLTWFVNCFRNSSASALERPRQSEDMFRDVGENQVRRYGRDLIQPCLAELALYIVFAGEAEPAVELQAGIRRFP